MSEDGELTLAALTLLSTLTTACQAQQIVYIETSGAHGGPTDRPELDPDDATPDAGEESTSTGEPDASTSTGATVGVEDTAGEETTSSTSGEEESSSAGTTGEPEETTVAEASADEEAAA